eukprot:GHVO01041346.1.p1 GENE.GHVO01041346.1~~GHVO01041346.1.p1  ORF type:complete len:170 (+),score=34.48 GHVO01041346.1:16-525(+)
MAICAIHPVNQLFSHEELRWEDYKHGIVSRHASFRAAPSRGGGGQTTTGQEGRCGGQGDTDPPISVSEGGQNGEGPHSINIHVGTSRHRISINIPVGSDGIMGPPTFGIAAAWQRGGDWTLHDIPVGKGDVSVKEEDTGILLERTKGSLNDPSPPHFPSMGVSLNIHVR